MFEALSRYWQINQLFRCRSSSQEDRELALQAMKVLVFHVPEIIARRYRSIINNECGR